VRRAVQEVACSSRAARARAASAATRAWWPARALARGASVGSSDGGEGGGEAVATGAVGAGASGSVKGSSQGDAMSIVPSGGVTGGDVVRVGSMTAGSSNAGVLCSVFARGGPRRDRAECFSGGEPGDVASIFGGAAGGS